MKGPLNIKIISVYFDYDCFQACKNLYKEAGKHEKISKLSKKNYGFGKKKKSFGSDAEIGPNRFPIPKFWSYTNYIIIDYKNIL